MKKIIYIHDLQFYRVGSSFFTSSNLPEKYFDRFFDAENCQVEVFSRLITLNSISELPKGFEKINNPRLSLAAISPSKYMHIFNPFFIIMFLRNLKDKDVIVANIPSILGMFTLIVNLLIRKKYSVEVAADYDQFSSKRGGNLVSLMMKPLMLFFVSRAIGASYVSNYLKNKFHCRGECLISSNVNIDNVSERNYSYREGVAEISFIGGLNERKGLLNLLEAISFLKNMVDKEIILNIVGGHEDRDWEAVVEKLDLSDRIRFHGILKKEQVMYILEGSDIYVQPSLTEGIPRATLEAMSKGLPVIATKLPGFFEILDKDVLVSPNSSEELTNKIKELIGDKDKLLFYSQKNKNKAKEFTYNRLHNLRKTFYQKILSKI
ncbi:glycosyltransferase family 4 protein [Shewanella algae]|uniref:glycosyltransferase family 4 protein n=1 Tax=Shewanella algae TaxID=38313 RepID=UPI0031F490F5